MQVKYTRAFDRRVNWRILNQVTCLNPRRLAREFIKINNNISSLDQETTITLAKSTVLKWFKLLS